MAWKYPTFLRLSSLLRYSFCPLPLDFCGTIGGIRIFVFLGILPGIPAHYRLWSMLVDLLDCWAHLMRRRRDGVLSHLKPWREA